jgi:hypothetical protein
LGWLHNKKTVRIAPALFEGRKMAAHDLFRDGRKMAVHDLFRDGRKMAAQDGRKMAAH